MKVDLTPKEQLELSYLNLDFDQLNIEFDENPLQNYVKDPLHSVLATITDTKYLYFTCKHILNIDLPPYQDLLLQLLFKYPIFLLIGSRGAAKTFTLSLYILLVMMMRQGVKIVVVGAAFRQSKIVGQYLESFWECAPVLRDFCGGNKKPMNKHNDRWEFRIGESVCIMCPLGSGDTIRGLRANIVVADEFSSITPEVFEIVVRGFAAVSNDPIEKIKYVAKLKRMQELNLIDMDIKKQMLDNLQSNQVIISGTAYYSFNHFCDYWKKYKRIVENHGDPTKYADIIDPENPIEPKDVCIVRIPSELAPVGLLDEKQLAQYKMAMNNGVFNIEFGACFPEDSNGFFSRRLIETCTFKEPTQLGNDLIQPFSAQLKGSRFVRHVMGVDPASSADNFSIVVMAIYPTYRKIVYCWTIRKSILVDRIKSKKVEQQDYYGYCAKKIRQVMKNFPNIELIALDSQGGGEAGIAEALADKDKIPPGELPIYPIDSNHVLSNGEKRYTDDLPGKHIIELVNFASATYTSGANHGLKKDLEDKVVLFPFFDAISIITANIQDENDDIEIDNLESCMMEIEELKDELSSIQHTATTIANRDHWDVPKIKLPDNKVGRLRKDRYSALIMANYAARRIDNMQVVDHHMEAVGGVARDQQPHNSKGNEVLFIGPDWASDLFNLGGFAVRR